MNESEFLPALVGKFLDIVGRVMSPSTRLHWLYLLSAVLMAVWVYYRHERSRSGRSLLGFLFPRSVFLHRSALADYIYVALSQPLWILMLAPLVVSPDELGRTVAALGERSLGAVDGDTSGVAVGIAYTVAVFLATDLALYGVHWCMHRVPFLWEFHKVHHSAEVLTPLTSYREHPVELFALASAGACAIGLVTGVFLYLFPGALSPVTIFGVNAGRFAFFVLGTNLRHSHVWLSFGPVLERVFISPAQHQIHHSSDPKHFDRNFGTDFALWDWLFGTLYVPRERETLTYGLGPEENRRLSNVWQLFFAPFGGAARTLRRRRATLATTELQSPGRG